MPKATWNGAVLAESDKTIVIEGNHYFPADAIRTEYFKPRAPEYRENPTRRWVKTATLALPLLRQGATPSPSSRWPPEPPGR
jgi:Domain of unknown function (DUF427)